MDCFVQGSVATAGAESFDGTVYAASAGHHALASARSFAGVIAFGNRVKGKKAKANAGAWHGQPGVTISGMHGEALAEGLTGNIEIDVTGDPATATGTANVGRVQVYLVR